MIEAAFIIVIASTTIRVGIALGNWAFDWSSARTEKAIAAQETL